MERVAAIERAIELDDPPNPARRARLLALKALELEWDPDFERRRALVEEAISLAARVRGTRGRSQKYCGACRRSERRKRSSLANRARPRSFFAAPPPLGDPALRYWAHDFDFHACFERGGLRAREARLSSSRH